MTIQSTNRTAARLSHPDIPGAVFFTTARAQSGAHPFVGTVAAAAMSELRAVRDANSFLLLAFALMPDHAHFVIAPTDGYTVSQTMRAIKGAIARRVNLELGRKGPIWQRGYYDRVAHTREELNAYIAYTHRNPVAAGIVAIERAYAYSSARGQCDDDYSAFCEVAR